MSEIDYGALYAKAIEESGAGSEILPTGEYNVKIAAVKPGQSKGGKFQFGICLAVLDGPHAGKRTWINQTFSPESPKSVAVVLRILKDFGVPQSAIAAAQPPEVLIGYIVKDTTGVVKLKGDRIFNDKPQQDLQSFKAAAVAVEALQVPVAAAPAAPAPVLAAPAPAVPVPGVAAEPF